MDLTIKEVADILSVPVTTVHLWVEEKKIPAYKIKEQYLFSRIEVDEWMMNHKFGQMEGGAPFKTRAANKLQDTGAPQGSKQFCLYRALHKGEVLQGVPGNNKQEIIEATTKEMAKNLDLDSSVLTDLLLDRERLQPTALGCGIAVPHTRDFLLNRHYDVVTIAFPKEPIPYGALDGEPVHTLFFLFACDDTRHLHMLAKIAHLSSTPDALELLRSQPNKEELLEYVKGWESKMRKET